MSDLRRRPRLVLAVLVGVSLLLIAIDLRSAVVSDGLRAVTGTVVAPIQRTAAAVAYPIRAQLAGMREFGSEQARSQEVAESIGDPGASAPAPKAPELRLTSDQWREPVAAIRQSGRTLLPARVTVASGSESSVTTLAIDAGSEQGVAVDQAVLAPSGLVGRIVRAGRGYAIVELLSSGQVSVGARLGESGQLGVVSGRGEPNASQFRPLDSAAALKPGEAVVTAGSPGAVPYPPGVPIGVLGDSRGALGQPGRSADVRLAAPLTALTVVAVVVAKEPS